MRIISGIHKNRLISAPKGLKTRPTSEKLRESLFNICQFYVRDALFLDLFAGSGAMGLEALSRGARKAYFVDIDREAIRCIKENVATLGFEDKAVILKGDVFTLVNRFAQEGLLFDIVYADPPYDEIVYNQGRAVSMSDRVIHLLDQVPLLKKEGTLFVEESTQVPLKAENMEQLDFIKSRNFGHSALYQFTRNR